jgi:outer membrane protein with beta-barrel domain
MSLPLLRSTAAASALAASIGFTGAAMADGDGATARPPTISVGISLGGSWADRQEEEETELQRHGIVTPWSSLLVIYQPTRYLGLQTGFSYLRKGFGYQELTLGDPNNPDAPIERIEPRTELDYLELPLLLRGSLPLGSRLSAHVVAGPSLSILLAANMDLLTSPVRRDVDITDDADRLDINAVAGIGGEWSLGKAALSLDLTYEHGLTTVDFTGDSPITPGDPPYLSMQNRAVILSVGIRTTTALW